MASPLHGLGGKLTATYITYIANAITPIYVANAIIIAAISVIDFGAFTYIIDAFRVILYSHVATYI